MKCQSIRPLFVSSSKMVEILCIDADFIVSQCVINNLAFCSDSNCKVVQCAIKSCTGVTHVPDQYVPIKPQESALIPFITPQSF
jgi:hypothetical protein